MAEGCRTSRSIPNRDIVMTDSAARRPAAEKWLNHRNLYFALRFVARERDEHSLTADDYGDTRDQLFTADSHRIHSFLATILPTQGQIIQIVRRLEAQAVKEKAAAEKAAEDETGCRGRESGRSGSVR